MRKFFIPAMLAFSIFLAGCNILSETEMIPTEGKVCFEVQPEEAEIWVDGVMAGTAKDLDENAGCMALPAGRHAIKVSAPGYRPYERDYYVGESKMVIRVNLIPSD